MLVKISCAIAVTLAVVVSACGSSRGEKCASDDDCDTGQECISPGCATSQKRCAITCRGGDGDCKSKGDSGDRCVKPNANCVAYCTPG